MGNYPDCGFPDCGYPACGMPNCVGFGDGAGSGPPAADRLHAHFDASAGLTFQGSGAGFENVDTWSPQAGSGGGVTFRNTTGTDDNSSGFIRYYANGIAEIPIPLVCQVSTSGGLAGLLFDSNVDEPIRYIAAMAGYYLGDPDAPAYINGTVNTFSFGSRVGGGWPSNVNIVIGSTQGDVAPWPYRAGSWWSEDGVQKRTAQNDGVFLPVSGGTPPHMEFVDFGMGAGNNIDGFWGTTRRPTRYMFHNVLMYTAEPTQEERLEIKAYLEGLRDAALAAVVDYGPFKTDDGTQYWLRGAKTDWDAGFDSNADQEPDVWVDQQDLSKPPNNVSLEDYAQMLEKAQEVLK